MTDEYDRIRIRDLQNEVSQLRQQNGGPKRPEYEPTDDMQRLAYLVEECGEVLVPLATQMGKVLAALGKTLRWGPESYNPEVKPADRETNAAWLLRESADLQAALDRAVPRLRTMVEENADSIRAGASRSRAALEHVDNAATALAAASADNDVPDGWGWDGPALSNDDMSIALSLLDANTLRISTYHGDPVAPEPTFDLPLAAIDALTGPRLGSAAAERLRWSEEMIRQARSTESAPDTFTKHWGIATRGWADRIRLNDMGRRVWAQVLPPSREESMRMLLLEARRALQSMQVTTNFGRPKKHDLLARIGTLLDQMSDPAAAFVAPREPLERRILFAVLAGVQHAIRGGHKLGLSWQRCVLDFAVHMLPDCFDVSSWNDEKRRAIDEMFSHAHPSSYPLENEGLPGQHVLAELEHEIHRLRANHCPTMKFGFSPAEIADAVRAELAEVAAEVVGSDRAREESAGVIAVAVHLAIVHGANVEEVVAAETRRLRLRLDHVESGGTWAEAKAMEKLADPAPAPSLAEISVQRDPAMPQRAPEPLGNAPLCPKCGWANFVIRKTCRNCGDDLVMHPDPSTDADVRLDAEDARRFDAQMRPTPNARDPIAQLFQLVSDAGLKMTLYGNPVESADALRTAATSRAIDRILDATVSSPSDKVRAEVLRFDQPWSVPMIVDRLVHCADALLDMHSSDRLGWETAHHARAAGIEWLTALRWERSQFVGCCEPAVPTRDPQRDALWPLPDEDLEWISDGERWLVSSKSSGLIIPFVQETHARWPGLLDVVRDRNNATWVCQHRDNLSAVEWKDGRAHVGKVELEMHEGDHGSVGVTVDAGRGHVQRIAHRDVAEAQRLAVALARAMSRGVS